MLCVSLGARAGQQAAAFGLCFATGLVAGIFALLYLRRAGFWERLLSDLFASAALAAGAMICCEFFLGGKPELYGIVAYLAGASVLPLIVKTARKVRDAKKRENGQNPPK